MMDDNKGPERFFACCVGLTILGAVMTLVWIIKLIWEFTQ